MTIHVDIQNVSKEIKPSKTNVLCNKLCDPPHELKLKKMPEMSINESSNPEVESTDVVVVINSPEQVSISPQGHELQDEPPGASVPTTETAEEEEDLAASTSNQGECRICLMSDEVGQLIEPCSCTGSVQFAHLKCLKLWVHERADLHCEICKSMYKESLLSELEPDLLIGIEERNRRNDRRRLRHLHDEEDGMVSSTDRIIATQIRREEQQRESRRRLVLRALCITVPLTILVVMLLFLGMNASDNAWAAILLRIFAFALPTFIIIRIVFTCWNVARFGGWNEDDGLRRGVGV